MNLDDLPPGLAGRHDAGLAAALTGQGAGALVEMQALVLRHESFDTAATALAGDLALRLGCTRVCVAVREAARPNLPARLAAISHGADPDARRAAVRGLADAADEALDQAMAIELPTVEGSPAAARVAHAALLAGGDAAAVLSAPFDTESAMAGVLIFESFEPLDDAQRALALDAAMFVGPVLMLKARLDAPFAVRLRARMWAARREGLSTMKTAMLVGVLGLAGFLAWPTTSHVVAQARVEGLGQRVVTAPTEGFLRTVAARPGETVKAGQLLATLDDREPTLELERASAEQTQFDRQYRDALARDDAGQAVIARAKLEQAQAQFELARQRLERTRLTAPFDGVLIGGDLGPSVGMPVRRGQELMVVAPTQGWRIVAEVDEVDVATVQPGQKAHALFAAVGGPPASFEVERLAPVSVQTEGRNVFEAEGRLGADATGLRPGLRGVVRIEAGQRSPAAVWWSRGSHWLRRQWWALMS